jgi:hypothetical protein
MKILSVRAARCIWLVPTAFLNPRGLSLKAPLAAFVERYAFKYEAPEGEKKGHRFAGGAFTKKGGAPIEIQLTIHDEGLVAENRSSTEDGDLFLEDSLGWLASDFGFPRHADLPIKKIYGSELFVQLEKRPSTLDSKLRGFTKLLSATLGTSQSGPFDLAHLNFGSDPEPSQSPAVFRFEREAGVRFAENRYYSFAPCQTEAHLKLLSALEKILTAR